MQNWNFNSGNLGSKFIFHILYYVASALAHLPSGYRAGHWLVHCQSRENNFQRDFSLWIHDSRQSMESTPPVLSLEARAVLCLYVDGMESKQNLVKLKEKKSIPCWRE
jgi:hypothetical protein